MSIKGIDTQIMIARSTDFIRDASDTQKRPEIVQDNLALREKITDAQDQTRVAKTLEAEHQRLDPDAGGSGGGSGGGQGHGEGRKKDKPEAEMLVPPGSSKIDIRV